MFRSRQEADEFVAWLAANSSDFDAKLADYDLVQDGSAIATPLDADALRVDGRQVNSARCPDDGKGSETR